MEKSYIGVVIDGASRKADRLVIELPTGTVFSPGATVRVTEIADDATIGRMFREAMDGYSREEAAELMDAIENYGGHPDLAKLILEVTP